MALPPIPTRPVHVGTCHGCGQLRQVWEYPKRAYCYPCLLDLVGRALGVRKAS